MVCSFGFLASRAAGIEAGAAITAAAESSSVSCASRAIMGCQEKAAAGKEEVGDKMLGEYMPLSATGVLYNQ